MNASRFIAGRLRFGGRLAVASIAISFLVMIVAIAISAGFRRELREGISNLSGDVQITPLDLNYMNEDDPVSASPSYLEDISSVGGVREIVPAVYRAGIVKVGSNIHGVVFKGVPGGGDSLGVSVPRRLCSMLGIEEGDDLLAYFVGEKVKVRKFRVESTYQGIVSGDENLIVYAGLSDMQRLNGWNDDQVSALEVRLSPSYRSARAVQMASGEIGFRILSANPAPDEASLARSSLERFPQIFSWLDLIDFNVVAILILMTLVAGFNMISGLLILLFRNISTIGTLKSLGMTNRGIAEVFLRVASNLVLKGMAIGNALALVLCAVQGATHLVKLNPENYFLSFVPVHINPLVVIGIDIAAYIVIMLLMLIPCIFISKVDPAKTVRAQ